MGPIRPWSGPPQQLVGPVDTVCRGPSRRWWASIAKAQRFVIISTSLESAKKIHDFMYNTGLVLALVPRFYVLKTF